jgi:hypothetical protein
MEIGGYFSLESYGENLYHKKGIYLNSARNALRYIIQAHNIKELFSPYYTCPVVFDVLDRETCKIKFYDIDKTFMPIANIPNDSYILYNDYFGVFEDNVKNLLKKYPKLIIDNAQSFYSIPRGMACFYSPRKFFGLPDGGIAISPKKLNKKLKKDISYDRVSHLVKRLDLGAEAAYTEFMENDSKLNDLPIFEMSNLTKIMMGNINYASIRKIRCQNFDYLHNNLKNFNELNLKISTETVPMVYPLLIKKPGLRKYLIEQKIYIAKYWDGLANIIPSNSFSEYLTENLLPLPLDQRYSEGDMKRIVDLIYAYN